MPSARIRLNSTTMFSVVSVAYITLNVISIDTGIARATMTALRKPRKTKMTISTRISPLRMLFSRSETISRISCDWSMVTFISMPGSRRSSYWPAIRRTSSAIWMTFSPARFVMLSVTASWPFTRDMVSTSLKLS